MLPGLNTQTAVCERLLSAGRRCVFKGSPGKPAVHVAVPMMQRPPLCQSRSQRREAVCDNRPETAQVASLRLHLSAERRLSLRHVSPRGQLSLIGRELYVTV